MASRRVPLANVPSNIVNSPIRTTATKRGRSQSTAGEDALGGQPPAAKKQILGLDQPVPRTPIARRTAQAATQKAIERDALGARAQAPRERPALGRAVRQERAEVDSQSLETVRQWQKHYRKVFPTYVFYFENVPDNSRRQCSKAIATLGAREEKFFSREITHVITTRPLPNDHDQSTDTGPSSTAPSIQDATQPRTINPSLLDRTAGNLAGTLKTHFSNEISHSKKGATPLQDAEVFKQPQARVDVLQKAKDLNIKIWHLEKLQRVLATILDDGQPSHGHNTRSHVANVAAQPRPAKQNDLSQMIKNERLHQRGDREFSMGNADLIPLKGPYIYISDMNEKSKPIMMREYAKVQRKEDGEWPQFRSASVGKCPFVEEDHQSKQYAERERQKERERVTLAQAKAQGKAARRRAPAKVNSNDMRPPTAITYKESLTESQSARNSGCPQISNQLPPPSPTGDFSFTRAPSYNDPKSAFASLRPGFIRGEPMASGMQQSNITSAIRSQMISSTAPAPGAKAGTSKEIHGLQRKVLERNNGPLGLVSSRRMTDIAGTAARMMGNNPRAAKQKAQEKLGYKPEPIVLDEEDEEEEVAMDEKKSTVSRTEKKEPKPGYCENCREKFNDFDTHTQTRKHRKFALDKDNWRELDELLSVLARPLRVASN